MLRTEFGRQKVSFDRFDIAYAVLWQRLHPNLRITSRDLPFVAESEVMTQIFGLADITTNQVELLVWTDPAAALITAPAALAAQ